MELMSHPRNSHHTRFYIVLITLIIGGIFVLLLLNDNLKDSSVTGSSVNLFDENTGESITETEKLMIEPETENFQKLRSREVNVALSFDTIPSVSKEAKIEDLEVHFPSSGTKIMINSDYLELNSLVDVQLQVEGFKGKIDFDSTGFLLDGTAKRIKVNGMGFSAKDSLSISLRKVSYDYLFVDEISLKDVHLPRGNGQLSIADKLQYTLEQEEVNFYSFIGKMIIDDDRDSRESKESNETLEADDRSLSSLITMEGVAKGTDISGALLNLDVR